MWQGISADQVITFTEGTGTPVPERP